MSDWWLWRNWTLGIEFNLEAQKRKRDQSQPLQNGKKKQLMHSNQSIPFHSLLHPAIKINLASFPLTTRFEARFIFYLICRIWEEERMKLRIDLICGWISEMRWLIGLFECRRVVFFSSSFNHFVNEMKEKKKECGIKPIKPSLISVNPV